MLSKHSSVPWEVVSVDLWATTSCRSHAGYEYLLVAVDHFSKWSEIILLKRATGQTRVQECTERVHGLTLKQYYDRSRSVAAVCFQAEDHVMVRTHPQSNASKLISAKLVLRWKGPCVVCERLTSQNIKLAYVHHLKELIVHVDQTKPVPTT